MTNERYMKFQELEGDAELVALATQLREAEQLKDTIFSERDHSPAWRIRYEAALQIWAKTYNKFEDHVRQVLA